VKRALISDIHGNYEALKAVLADIRSQGATDIYCLGDMVGYGPNPCECVDEVRTRCKVAICGNHDHAALWDPSGFNPVALRAIYWTREQLDNRGSRSAISMSTFFPKTFTNRTSSICSSLASKNTAFKATLTSPACSRLESRLSARMNATTSTRWGRIS
jgi:hypothetical protein